MGSYLLLSLPNCFFFMIARFVFFLVGERGEGALDITLLMFSAEADEGHVISLI